MQYSIQRAALCLLAALLPAALSAAEPEYWIEGLGLPEGRVVDRAVRAVTQDNAAQHDIAAEGKEEEVLLVSFDSALDWPAVEQHFADTLAVRGYRRFNLERLVRKQIRGKGRSRPDAEATARKVLELSENVVIDPAMDYAAVGSELYVVLMDMQRANMLAGKLAAGMGQPAAPRGRYMLMVVRLAEQVLPDESVLPALDAAPPVECRLPTICSTE